MLNGDAMVGGFQQSGIAGPWTIWREAVIDGPVDFDMASAELCAARAQALADLCGIDPQTYADDFAQRERCLAECEDGCELVLWFEADGFCELHPPVLALEPEQLRAEFERRHPVSIECRSEAREAWRRYCEADPR